MTPPFAILLSLLLLLLSLSHARNLQTSFPQPQPHPHQLDTVSFTVDSLDPVPLTLLRFRPINRRFRPLPLASRCRHAHRRQIAYGNDMIQLSQIPPRWARVHADAVKAKSTAATVEDHRDEHHRQNHHRHYHHHVREESLFAKKIREFLNLF